MEKSVKKESSSLLTLAFLMFSVFLAMNYINYYSSKPQSTIIKNTEAAIGSQVSLTFLRSPIVEDKAGAIATLKILAQEDNNERFIK